MRYLLAFAALLAASAAEAQTVPNYSYPSQGTPPFVQLQCDGNYQNCLPVGPNNVPPVKTLGGANLATAQTSVGTTATLVAAARTGRQRIILSIGAANTCAFGNAGVTATTGFPLQPTAGASLSLDTNAAIYAVCSATTTISDVEMF